MKKYIVYGLGISGMATAKYLSSNGYFVVATDDNPNSIENFKKNNSKNYSQIKFLNPNEIEYNDQTIIIFSPGIPLFFPKAHSVLKICSETNALLKCDISLFYKFNSKNNFIGITGTNGKSTTTALTGFIFDNLNLSSQIGGNIGIPCFELKQNQQDFTYIFEVSSYQLDLISDAKFNIACLTNITPDHIDRHGSFENYINSKRKIFQLQNANDFSIINIDNTHSRKIYQELKQDSNRQSNLVAISTNIDVENGVSIIKDKLTINLEKQKFTFLIKPQIQGKHNLENIACSIAITSCQLIKINQFNSQNIERVIKIIEKFQGLKHRMQLVKSINNINFINDSKATNAESTENALKSFDNIFWILGGRPKDGGIEILKPYFSKIIKAYLIGESTEEFAKILDQHHVIYEKSQTLKKAFESAYSDSLLSTKIYKNILLSPACASFDQWKNFEQRGDFFCDLVNEIH
ncbi:MAG: UDP-N-acetylmuramoyl-L-alanine--D-glutamate ligase [Proteobacteria bacterium]|nr:UDP-N-acetylmuramoyl-L-alanine--D-glutamate ligase [Pseudomonadota bacterium]NCA27741.1 UDP-N-acetylmuramoyl-L-alanine--D-glutamate ligase [Pseudomonadota bacterium]